jgi:glutathione S-transferase
MTLYFAPKTRASRARWMLEELGLPYTLVTLDLAAGEHRRPEYLAVHPLGQVPALEDGGVRLMESAAICQYLADKAPEAGLAPPVGSPERGEYYQWMMFAMTGVEPHLVALSGQAALPEGQRDAAVQEKARARFEEAARVLEARLSGGREVLVGGRFTAVDVVVASIAVWAGSMGLLADFPALQAYGKAHVARPAARRARGP